MAIWTVDPLEVTHLQGQGGERFAQFVDGLIRAQGLVARIPASAIKTNCRQSVPDGGVDTEVAQGAAAESSGWLRTPTCWQYKARTWKGLRPRELLDDMRKPDSRALIAVGYAYRLAICDDFPPPSKSRLERELASEARRIDAAAANPKVLNASDLAAWASAFPSIVVQFFKPYLMHASHMRAWGDSMRAVTPTFVDVELWAPVREAIIQHVRLDCTPPAVVLPLQGEAGVGKTRLVYETLAADARLGSLVLYTLDEARAVELATGIANDSSTSVILVADECSVETRLRLAAILRGCLNRVRVITIDNTCVRPSDAAQEFWLERMPTEALEQVLQRNFPRVPPDRLARYVALSGGFVKLAADLCEHDARLTAHETLEPALRNVSDYLRIRLTDPERRVVDAFALVTKVGFRDEVAGELEALCDLVGLEVGETRQAASKIKDAPGFITRAGRFYYVTPEIVAQAAFEAVWQRCAKDDPAGFLRRVPETLLPSFLERAASTASEEVRRIVADFFSAWARQVRPVSLSTLEVTSRLAILAEAEPGRFLPIIEGLLVAASPGEVRAIEGRVSEGWGPRRTLVWLAEKLARFPQWFGLCESILLRLALNESEAGIANNATAIWVRLFRPLLSGTATPFTERLSYLRRRVYEPDTAVRGLALKALSAVFAGHAWRTSTPPVVGGRLPPDEWQPSSDDEYRECIERAGDLLGELRASAEEPLRDAAFDIGVANARVFLQLGYLARLENLFVGPGVERVLPRLIDEAEDFCRLAFHDRAARDRDEYIREVRNWINGLLPGNFQALLRVVVGRSPWSRRRGDEESLQRQRKEFAVTLRDDPALLGSELPWLCSEEARSAVALGEELGRVDVGGICLWPVTNTTLKTGFTGLARGYYAGIATTQPGLADLVRDALDSVEAQSPRIAFELSWAAGATGHALERSLQMVSKGILDVDYLDAFTVGTRDRPLSMDEFKRLLATIVEALRRGSKGAARVGLDVAWHGFVTSAGLSAAPDPEARELLWAIAELTAETSDGETTFWADLLTALGKSDALRATRVSVRGLVGRSVVRHDAAMRVLIELARNDPEKVMESLGEVMLDEDRGWQFFVGQYRTLFTALPSEVVQRWLATAGVRGAQMIARHLPTPFLRDGEPVVPPLTEWVLREFENDDRTFQEFCAGVHSYQLYSGSIAAQHRAEAAMARLFLNHPLRRVREWAAHEVAVGEAAAAEWQREEEERHLD